MTRSIGRKLQQLCFVRHQLNRRLQIALYSFNKSKLLGRIQSFTRSTELSRTDDRVRVTFRTDYAVVPCLKCC